MIIALKYSFRSFIYIWFGEIIELVHVFYSGLVVLSILVTYIRPSTLPWSTVSWLILFLIVAQLGNLEVDCADEY